MGDFKIGDNVEEQTSEVVTKKLKGKRKIAIIAVVIISLLIGIGTFLISNAFFNKDDQSNNTDTPVSIEDKNVKILYEYVTYGTRGIRNDKFAREESVTINSFDNDEKFYYALQFARAGDFEYTGEINKNKDKVYLISDDTIKKFMRLFFGPSISYKSDIELSYPFSFSMNGMNVGTMKHSLNKDGYETTFKTYEADIKEPNNLVIGKLESARTDLSGKMILTEKVVYATITKNEDNTYTMTIYKDRNKETKLDTKIVTTIDDKMDISNYPYKTTIEYTFALDGNTYYFESSKILD